MLVRNKRIIFLTLISLFSHYLLAKDQKGDSFRASYVPTFPQRNFVDQLNSLQVVTIPLSGEPFFSKFQSAINHTNDEFKKLMDVFPEYSNRIESINELDEITLHSGQSKNQTWSYHSFPTYKGGLAYRYLDSFYENSEDWNKIFDYYQTNSSKSLIENNQINILSPIEKYEYLIGNLDFNLTKKEWSQGADYIKSHGEIPDWFGLCNGTAPSTINNSRPQNAIVLKSFDNKNDILFYPSDIKALLAYAWATAGSASEMMGGRCDSIIQPGVRPPLNCLDTNPGSFHMAVINLLGVNGQAFIMDSASGNEVWNRSVVSYQFNYFRPGTRNLTDKLKYALIPISEYKNDPYQQYRALGTTQIVGVSMELTYLIGTKPSSEMSNHSSEDMFLKTTYWYDLEIDQAGIVIGGEWQEQLHPDFLWVVAQNYQPKTFYDYVIGSKLFSYEGNNSLSDYVQSQGRTAAHEGKILFTILEAMLRLSNDPHYNVQVAGVAIDVGP